MVINYFNFFLLFWHFCLGQTIEIVVHNAEMLEEALQIVSPGDFIILDNNGSPGPVTFEGRFLANRSGTANSPITLLGHPDIWLKNPDNSFREGGLMIRHGADHWVVSGLNLKDSLSGLDISSDFNRFENIQITGCYTGIQVMDGNDNEFYSSHITYNNDGLNVFASNRTTFSGGEIQGSSRIAIEINIESRNTTVEGFRVTNIGDFVAGLVYLSGSNTYGTIIRNNTFIVSDTTNARAIWDISDDTSDGLFEGNELTYGAHLGYTPVFLDGSNYILKGNKFFNGDNRANTMIYLGNKALGNIIKGNEMHFTDLDYPRDIACIRGYPEIHIRNTGITCDNICEGGKLTTIYDNV